MGHVGLGTRQPRPSQGSRAQGPPDSPSAPDLRPTQSLPDSWPLVTAQSADKSAALSLLACVHGHDCLSHTHSNTQMTSTSMHTHVRV